MVDDAAMPAIETPTGISLAYETVGDPADPPLLLVAGYRNPADRLAAPLLRAARRRRPLRDPSSTIATAASLRSSRGPSSTMDAVSAAVATGDFARAAALAPYTLSAMAGRRGRPARRPRDRARPRGRRLDGRDDRPDARDRAPGAAAQPHLDHVQHWRGRVRPAHRAGARGAPRPLPHRSGRLRQGGRRPGDGLGFAPLRRTGRSARRWRAAATTAASTPRESPGSWRR